MKIILQKERPISWNKYYSGMHWSERNDEALRVHDLVTLSAYEQLKAKGKMKVFKVPVNITVTVYFDKSLQDADNIASKLYIDGLKYLLLTDDSPDWVRSVTTVSKKDGKNPRMEIEIEPVSFEG